MCKVRGLYVSFKCNKYLIRFLLFLVLVPWFYNIYSVSNCLSCLPLQSQKVISKQWFVWEEHYATRSNYWKGIQCSPYIARIFSQFIHKTYIWLPNTQIRTFHLKQYYKWNESVKIKVSIYVLKYLTNLHSKDFQNYRSPEGSLLYVNEADQIPMPYKTERS